MGVSPGGGRCRARHPALEGYAPRRERSRRLGSAPSRPCGPLCRPPPGELAGGRRSKPSPPIPAVGAARSPRASGEVANAERVGREQRHPRGFRAPARCRPEASAPLSRAILPLRGTCREGSYPDGWGLRRRGPAGRCADRRSAFPGLRAIPPVSVTRFRPLRGAVPGPTGRTGQRAAFPCGRCRQGLSSLSAQKTHGSELCSLPA